MSSIAIPTNDRPFEDPLSGSRVLHASARRNQSMSSGAIVLTVLGIVGVVLLVCCGGVLLLLIPAVDSARDAARGAAQRMQCSNNLKQMGLAFHNHHDVQKRFPPAATLDDDGRPVRSWRVDLLPYVEQMPLYDAYDIDQPWDSEHNLMVAENFVEMYQCPANEEPITKIVKGHEIPCTNYVMVTSGADRATIGGGPDDIDPKTGAQGVNMSKIMDGTSNTILVLEVQGDDLPAWTEPVDISIDELQAALNGTSSRYSLADCHEGGFNTVLGDGAARFIPNTISGPDLESMATRAGGEAPVMFQYEMP